MYAIHACKLRLDPCFKSIRDIFNRLASYIGHTQCRATLSTDLHYLFYVIRFVWRFAVRIIYFHRPSLTYVHDNSMPIARIIRENSRGFHLTKERFVLLLLPIRGREGRENNYSNPKMFCRE
jgi:hypothetical protein